MQVAFRTLKLKKLYPLAISRGVTTGSQNLYVFVTQGAHTGIGECAPGTGFDDTLAALAERQLTDLVAEGIEDLSIHQVWDKAHGRGVDPSALAALDIALWDLLAKQANMPLYRLFGLGKPSVPTSVTIGINPVEVIRERVPDILAHTGARALKIKLGSPAGIEHDKASYEACLEAAVPFGVKYRVDANGGWDVEPAREILHWLAERGCDYVEQPLAEGREADLPRLYEGRPLPIFCDESARHAKDIPKLIGKADGINLKLMKCGGLTEALRLLATARSCGLGTMIGCMGESSVSISAGAALGALLDHVDLDSHLNLDPDPAEGAQMVNGVVTPPDRPGHGAFLKDAEA
jgi:muconate cycloisomerase